MAGAGGNGHWSSPLEKLWDGVWSYFPNQTQPLLKVVRPRGCPAQASVALTAAAGWRG